MTASATEMDRPRRSPAFLILFALAYGGGVIAYVPMLTLLLPLKVEGIAPDQKLALLSVATVAGALAASLANLIGGILSDRSADRPNGRRPWVIGGLAATLVSYGVLYMCRTPEAVIAGVVLYQACLNFMLAPLIAIAADEVPDAQKGLAGGLMGAAYPLGSLAGVAATLSPALGEGGGLLITAALIATAMAPFLVLMRRRGLVIEAMSQTRTKQAFGLRNLSLVWIARLLVQISGSILFTYYLYYFQSVDRQTSHTDLASDVAWVSASVALVTAPLSIMLGRLTDQVGRRKLFLAGAIAVMTLGLLIMGLLPSWTPAITGYALFACACAVFLALQQTYAMQLMPSARHRGRDLGILNLTNTLPAMISPVLAYTLAKVGDFRPLLLTLAALSLIGGVMTLMVREARPAH